MSNITSSTTQPISQTTSDTSVRSVRLVFIVVYCVAMAIIGSIGFGFGSWIRTSSSSDNATTTDSSAPSASTQTTQLNAKQTKLLSDIKTNLAYAVPAGFVATNYYTLPDGEGDTSYLSDLTESSSGTTVHIDKDSASWVKQEIISRDYFIPSVTNDSYFADQYQIALPSVQKPLAAMKYDTVVFEGKTFPVAWGRFVPSNFTKNDNPYLLGFALLEANGSTYIVTTVARPAGQAIDEQVKVFEPTLTALLRGFNTTD